MIFLKKILCFSLLLLPAFGWAQENFTLSGYIKDVSSGEDLSGATVAIVSLNTGTYSNEYGFFSISLPAGTHVVRFSYGSYAPRIDTLLVEQDLQLNVNLTSSEFEMETVVITGEREDRNVSAVEMSSASLKIETIRKLPVLFGEYDVLRSMQLLPGIQSVGEGITGYYVRGGGADQNMIMLDEANVYNAAHLLGFFSVFNPDALKDDIKLYKGGIPARYGGRLSSVMDLRMKEGNLKSFHGSGGIGLISSRLSFEGPIVKDKGSFIVMGRRTYGDLFLNFAKRPELKNNKLFFYDMNAKVNYRLGDKDRIYLSGYLGRDVFNFQDQFGNEWGNQTASLRWNHLFSDKLFMNSSLIFSNFDYGFDFDRGGGDRFQYEAGIRDWTWKTDLTHFVSPKIRMRYGATATWHSFRPGSFTPLDTNGFYIPINLPRENGLESAIYVENEHDINNRLSLSYGLRASSFTNIGPHTDYIYDAEGNTRIDSTVYGKGAFYHTWAGLEPRFSARLLLDEKQSLKASYNRTFQYLHLASNSVAAFPWDIWVPSSPRLKPEIADQLAIGYFRNFRNNRWELSVEGYYKWMQNQFEFRNGAQLLLNDDLESEFLFGDGQSYGMEFLLQKTAGKITGLVSYTLSKTRLQIEGINNGNWFPARNDRRHDLAVVVSRQFSERLSVSANFIYYTGAAVTFPAGKYVVAGQTVEYYDSRNLHRMPDYHRLDFSLNLDGKKKPGKRWQSNWNFSIYNAYGRKNAFAILFEPDEADPAITRAVKVYLFRWVPSVTYNFTF